MRKSAPMIIKLYTPTTESGFQDLAKRVSDIHADFVAAKVGSLRCPFEQRQALINAVIKECAASSNS